MNAKVLSSVYHKVRDACLQPSNIFGFGIWSHHIRPMIDTARELAPLYDADQEMVLLCVLLHDYAGISNKALIEEHHEHGADEARRILSAHAYPVDRITIISDAILVHRGSIPGEKNTNEARCLADCDAISHIQQFPSLYRVIYRDPSRSIDDGARWVKRKLERDWSKLSPAGRDYIRDTYTHLMKVIISVESSSIADAEPEW